MFESITFQCYVNFWCNLGDGTITGDATLKADRGRPVPNAAEGSHTESWEWMVENPTIRDRVIQTAAKIVVEPIFEADRAGSGKPTPLGYRDPMLNLSTAGRNMRTSRLHRA